MKLNKRDLKAKVATDIVTVFEDLLSYLHEDNPEFDEIVSLKARYNDIDRQYNIKSILKNDEYSIEINKIRNALIAIINKIDFQKEEKNSLLDWWNQLSHEWDAVFEANIGASPNEKKLKFLFEKQPLLKVESDNIEDLLPISNLQNLKDLTITSRSLKNLKGIENLINLEKLKIQSPTISNLDSIINLVNLKELYLYGLPISDFSSVNSLKKLSSLTIFRSPIKNLSFIKDLEDLKKIHFYEIEITDLFPMQNCSNLIEIKIARTPIESILPITNLKNLKVLKIEYTAIHSIDGIEKLTNLEDLVINDVKVTNLKPFYNLKNARNINFKYDPGYISMDDINELRKNLLSYCNLGFSPD